MECQEIPNTYTRKNSIINQEHIVQKGLGNINKQLTIIHNHRRHAFISPDHFVKQIGKLIPGPLQPIFKELSAPLTDVLAIGKLWADFVLHLL